MPKRNLVWIAIVTVIAMGLWQIPGLVVRRDTLYNQFSPLIDVNVQIRKDYVEDVAAERLVRGAIDGMVRQLDPYCAYFDPKQREQFDKRTQGQFFGIGILIDRVSTGELLIVSPIEGSPAFLAGLRAGDLITRIDEAKTVDLPNLEAGVDRIAGDSGTPVTLSIYRRETGEVLERSITRQLVIVPTVRGRARSDRSDRWEWDYLIDPAFRIGYVRILSFEGNTTAQFDEVMRKRLRAHDRQRGVQGLILDLRDNPGGLLDVVVSIANRFLSEGRIVSTRGRNSPEKPYLAKPEQTLPNFPVVLLVNRGSASASEILAGALRDHDRATLVGVRTYGKGSVQELIPLGEGNGSSGAIKLTTAYYYLPKGERIHGKGVEPNRVVELTEAQHAARIEAMRTVYSTAGLRPASQPTTTTAPGATHVEIMIDPQLEEALTILRSELATRPAG